MSKISEIKTARRKKIYSLIVQAVRCRMRGDLEGMMATVGDSFLELQGVYVKFLQGVLLQHPLMKHWQTAGRYKIFEHVEPAPIDIGAFLQEQFSAVQLQNLQRVETDPFAAGSFGQVYRAWLRDGTPVIIKAQRPYAKEILAHDLKMIKLVAKLFTNVFSSWDADLKSLVKEFTKATWAETDYVAEQSFASVLYEQYATSKQVVIPKTYLVLSNQYVITQEYIGGISAAELIERKASGEDPDQIVRAQTGSSLSNQLLHLGHAIMGGLFEGKSVHGDPHPGNIRFLSEDKVGLLDFGIAAVAPVHPKRFYQLIKQHWLAEAKLAPNPGKMFVVYLQYYSHYLYASLQKVSTEMNRSSRQKPVDLIALLEEVANELFSEHIDAEELQRRMGGIVSGADRQTSVSNTVNANNRFGLTADVEDPAMMRAWVSYFTLATALGRRDVLPLVYERVMHHVRAEMPELEIEEANNLTIDKALEILYAWLEGVAERDPQLFRKLRQRLPL